VPIYRLSDALRPSPGHRRPRLYPFVDAAGRLVGVATLRELREVLANAGVNDGVRQRIGALLHRPPVVAYPDEPLRVVVHRMAETGRTRLPVVERGEVRRLVGMIGLADLLHARRSNLEAEKRRERVLRLRRRRRQVRPGDRSDAGSDAVT
jgi:CBS-domain-containing membrane protein